MSTKVKHDHCEMFLRSKADASGLDLAISTSPFEVSYPEFPASMVRCPHGLPYWTQPTPEEAARLRAMNEPSRRDDHREE